MNDKMIIHWWDHTDGSRSCHENIPDAMAKDSYLGRVFHENDKWFFEMKDEKTVHHGPFKNSEIAMRALEAALDAEQISI